MEGSIVSKEGESAPVSRVVSGIQPSGKLHLGNYMGAVRNWIGLQSRYDCFFFIADWHALSTNYEHTGPIRNNVREMLLDWLSLGLDPQKCTLFQQSHVKEHAELYLLLGMMTPVAWLLRNPTYKDQMAQIENRDLAMYGFLGYPVLMTGDIVLYRATHVPVGQDQVPHLELAREIVRRFHSLYGMVFPEPLPILTESPKLPGLDGRKMSKSYDNCIFVSDPKDLVASKLKTMKTDVKRMRRSDPGVPEDCPVFSLHEVFTEIPVRQTIDRDCRTAAIGCIDCKQILATRIEAILDPAREARKEFESRPDILSGILEAGGEKAKKEAARTMDDVRDAMRIS
ncbi:MAG: tryptophan--tRNA ligase [Nitrospirota bacterium]|nr:tryptophan--tRNA ligase [Nitrospirota bacterium]